MAKKLVWSVLDVDPKVYVADAFFASFIISKTEAGYVITNNLHEKSDKETSVAKAKAKAQETYDAWVEEEYNG